MAVYDLAHIKDGYSDFSACSKKFDSLYSSFKSSYVSTCADSSINKMENTLNKYFQKIDTAYNKIGAVWKNFYSDIKASDNALAGGSKGGVSASSAVSILSSMPSLNDFSDSLNMSIKGNDIQVSDVSALSGIVLGESVAGYNLSTGHTTASDAQKDVGAKELMSEYVNDENSVFKRAFIKMPDGTMKEVDVEDGTTAEEIVDKYNISTDDLVFDVSDKNGTSQAWVSLNELTEGVEQPSNNMEVKAKFDTEIVEDNNTINNIADENNTENLTIETTTGDDALTTTKAESAATFGAIGGVVGSLFGNPLMGAALGAATGAIFSNNKVVSKITEKVVGGVKKVGEVFKRVAATVSTFVTSLVESVFKLVEIVVNLVEVIGTGIASVVTGIADGVNYVAAKAKGDDSLITHYTKEMWDKTRALVADDYVGNMFDSFYENTGFGQWMKNNAYGFETTRSIGIEVGDVLITVAIGLATGGKLKPELVYGLLKGTKAVEKNWQDEDTSTAKGLLKGVVTGTLDGLFFKVGAEADNIAKAAAKGVTKKEAAKILGKKMLFESGTAVTQDLSSIINDTLFGNDTITLEDGTKKTFSSTKEKFSYYFEQAGGFKGILSSMSVATILSGLSDSIDIGAARKGTTNNISKKALDSADDTLKLKGKVLDDSSIDEGKLLTDGKKATDNLKKVIENVDDTSNSADFKIVGKREPRNPKKDVVRYFVEYVDENGETRKELVDLGTFSGNVTGKEFDEVQFRKMVDEFENPGKKIKDSVSDGSKKVDDSANGSKKVDDSANGSKKASTDSSGNSNKKAQDNIDNSKKNNGNNSSSGFNQKVKDYAKNFKQKVSDINLKNVSEKLKNTKFATKITTVATTVDNIKQKLKTVGLGEKLNNLSKKVDVDRIKNAASGVKDKVTNFKTKIDNLSIKNVSEKLKNTKFATRLTTLSTSAGNMKEKLKTIGLGEKLNNLSKKVDVDRIKNAASEVKDKVTNFKTKIDNLSIKNVSEKLKNTKFATRLTTLSTSAGNMKEKLKTIGLGEKLNNLSKKVDVDRIKNAASEVKDKVTNFKTKIDNLSIKNVSEKLKNTKFATRLTTLSTSAGNMKEKLKTIGLGEKLNNLSKKVDVDRIKNAASEVKDKVTNFKTKIDNLSIKNVSEKLKNTKFATRISKSISNTKQKIETLHLKILEKKKNVNPEYKPIVENQSSTLKSNDYNSLYNFFYKTGNSLDFSYGADQGGIKNLCVYKLNGKKYTYKEAMDIVNRAKESGGVIPRFKKEAVSTEYFRLKNKLISQGFDSNQASVVLSSVDDVGACSYAAKANSIFYKFSNNPELFESKFGFPMYIKDSKGNLKLNSNELILDMYTYANDINNGGNLFMKYNNSNSYIFVTDSRIDVFGRTMLPTSQQKYFSTSIGSNSELLTNYLKTKGLDFNSKNIITNYGSNIMSNEAFNDVIKKVDSAVYDGKAVQLNIFQQGNSINMLSTNPRKYKNTNTKIWSEGGGHAVFVTGRTKQGFTVSSWGQEYVIPYKDLQNGGYFNIMIDDIN